MYDDHLGIFHHKNYLTTQRITCKSVPRGLPTKSLIRGELYTPFMASRLASSVDMSICFLSALNFATVSLCAITSWSNFICKVFNSNSLFALLWKISIQFYYDDSTIVCIETMYTSYVYLCQSQHDVTFSSWIVCCCSLCFSTTVCDSLSCNRDVSACKVLMRSVRNKTTIYCIYVFETTMSVVVICVIFTYFTLSLHTF